MKRHTLGVIALTLGLAVNGLAAEPIGQVVNIQGEATATATDGSARTLAMKSPIHLNDRVTTEPAGKVQILLSDDAIILIGEQSEMTFDEYVFSPDNAEENNSSMSLVKGLFRVITAKITDLNPERFKVKSNLATIGIRGCELGFDIQPDAEEIQIVRIPEKKEIVVANLFDAKDVKSILQQGVLISARRGQALSQRRLTPADVKRVVIATTPVVASRGKGKGSSGAAGADVADTSDGTEVDRGMDIADSDVYVEDAAAAPSAADTGAKAKDAADEGIVNGRTSTKVAHILRERVAEVVVVEELDMDVEDVMDEMADDDAAGDTVVARTAPVEPTDPVEPADPTDPVDPTDPPVEFPVIGDVVTTPRGGGRDWSWGSWEREDILGQNADGTPITRTLGGAEVSGNRLSPAEFQALAANGTPRTLTGTGIAAAGVTQGDQSRLLTGTSDINVLIGGNVTPNWEGTFSLGSSAGDSLGFAANGVLDASDGTVETGAGSYRLNAFGSSYGQSSLTENKVDAGLVGNKADGVTGSIGTFQFKHGAGKPSVDGVFGADVN